MTDALYITMRYLEKLKAGITTWFPVLKEDGSTSTITKQKAEQRMKSFRNFAETLKSQFQDKEDITNDFMEAVSDAEKYLAQIYEEEGS